MSPSPVRSAASVVFGLTLLSVLVLIGCSSQASSTAAPSSASPIAQSASLSGVASPTPLPTSAPPTATPTMSPGPVVAATWRPAGTMVSPQSAHTATLLPDGRVLVAGGLVNDRLDGRASALAELYDPDRGIWSATGKMRQARWDHTATLLANGKVLVAGGYDDRRQLLDSAELYDPDSGRWTRSRGLNVGGRET